MLVLPVSACPLSVSLAAGPRPPSRARRLQFFSLSPSPRLPRLCCWGWLPWVERRGFHLRGLLLLLLPPPPRRPRRADSFFIR